MGMCPCLTGCIFFSSAVDSEAVQKIKKEFCLGDCTNCARFRVYKALGEKWIPVDLAPEQQVRAETIIQHAE